MKKVKVMLMSALIVASVGGALAFKAHKSIGLFCGQETLHTCPDKTDGYTFDGVDPSNKVDGIICSTQANTDCQTVRLEN